jgi:hypothetical protein
MPANDRASVLNAKKLRELACWYREFAERAGESIREARLRIAEDLEHEATLLEQTRWLNPKRCLR